MANTNSTDSINLTHMHFALATIQQQEQRYNNTLDLEGPYGHKVPIWVIDFQAAT